MEQIVLKINRKHVEECYKKSHAQACRTHPLEASGNGCKFESMCNRIRRRL